MNLKTTSKILWNINRNIFFPRVERLILHVTRRCPLNCSHCFVNKNNEKHQEITLSQIKKIAGNLNPLMWLDIGGGEPFLRDDLYEICSQFSAVQIGIPTSGWFIDKTINISRRLFQTFGEGVLINVSIDGFKETHDKIRTNGSYERAIETLKGLLGITGLRVAIISTLSQTNIDELPEFIKYMKQYNVFSHNVNIMRGKPSDENMILPDVEKLRQFSKQLFTIIDSDNYKWKGLSGAAMSKFNIRYVKKKWDIALDILEQKRQVIPCLAGISHIVVHSNGDVSPCELLPSVGNINNDSFKSIINSDDINKAVKSIKNKECFCTHECNMLDNVLLNLNTFCKVIVL
jgi:MoaA/NifB/PqqE/SkfB family radical SAM enzyme